MGEITLRIPKLREGTYFPDEIVRPYSRVDRAVMACVREAYVRGMSTRRIERAAEALEFSSLSPSRVREWRRRMKAYGKLRYQMAGEGDLGFVGLEGRSEPVGHLFSGKEFLNVLLMDLADSSSHVTMATSWARYARVRAMSKALGGAIGRGVAVEVVLREPKKPSSEWRQVLAMLRVLGCEVRLAHGGELLDVVVVDRSLVWCGDVAPLAYPHRDGCSLRFVSREVAAELVETLTESSV